jgi:hypothetical protein
MIKGTAVGELCEIGNSPRELKDKLNALFKKDFTKDEMARRHQILKENYDNKANGERLIQLVF